MNATCQISQHEDESVLVALADCLSFVPGETSRIVVSSAGLEIGQAERILARIEDITPEGEAMLLGASDIVLVNILSPGQSGESVRFSGPVSVCKE